MEDKSKDIIIPAIYGGMGGAVVALALPLMIELGPVLLNWAMKIYENASRDPQTPEQKRATYADIANRLEAANEVVQNAPQPPPGSGR